MAEDGPGKEDRSVKAFKTFMAAQESVTKAAEKVAETTESILEAVGDDDQGLIAAIADLVDELQAHREEMRMLRQTMTKAMR